MMHANRAKVLCAGMLAVASVMLPSGRLAAQYSSGYSTNRLNQGAVEYKEDLVIGSNTCGNVLHIESGPVSARQRGIIGLQPGADGNRVVVEGAGTAWTADGALIVGHKGSGNELIIRQGAAVLVDHAGTRNGGNTGWTGFWGAGNSVTVSGAGSIWSNFWLCVGEWGISNSLSVTDGGAVISEEAWIGRNPNAHWNKAVISGASSSWRNSGTLYLGHYGMAAALEVRDGALLSCGALHIGMDIETMGGHVPLEFNELRVLDGRVSVTNAKGTATLTLGQSPSRFILSGGEALLDRLVVERGKLHLYRQHGPNDVRFEHGRLSCRNADVNNGREFVAGSGAAEAEYHLRGGTHAFADGLRIGKNGVLRGQGEISGDVTIEGRIELTEGKTVFKGRVINHGSIAVSGQGHAVFMEPVVNNGRIQGVKAIEFQKGVSGPGQIEQQMI